VATILEKLIVNLKDDLNNNKEKILLNINFPDIERDNIEGICATKLSKCLYNDYYETRIDPMGNDYYWLNGDLKQDFEKNTDIWAVNNKKISITPLQLNLTDDSERELLAKKFNSSNNICCI